MTNLIQKKFNSNSINIKNLDFIISEISNRMLDRLDYIKIEPLSILDIGSGVGIDKKGLQERYTKADVYSLESSINMLRQYNLQKSFWRKKLDKNLICADAVKLPIASQSIDLVWSNLTIPYIDDLKSYFAEINRVLKIGGTFLISGLGVDSLKEVRELGLATYNFPDMHLIGDILVELGFSNPVTDLEYITIEYNTLSELLADMRIMGCGAILHHNISKQQYNKLEDNFNKLTNNGKAPLTLEIFYAHAWKDHVRKDLVSGRSVIQFHHK